MAKKSHQLLAFSYQSIKKIALPSTLLLILIFLVILTFEVIFSDKFFPVTYVGDSNITFLTKAQAQRVINAKFSQRARGKLQFNSFEIDLATASAKLDYAALDEAFETEHSGFTLFTNLEIYPQIYFNLESQIDKIAQATMQKPQDARLIFNEITTPEGSSSARIETEDSIDGFKLDQEELKNQVKEYLLYGQTTLELPLKIIPPKITAEHVKKAKLALENAQAEPFKLISNNNIWEIDTKQLLAILDLESGGDLLLDKDKTLTYLQKIASSIDQEVQEGLFEFNPQTKRVTAFQASQEGRKLDLDKTYQLITNALTNQSQKSVTLPINIIQPKIQTQDVNSLGIKELLGQGISYFAGSIPNRIYNINLTAQKINGVLVAPGEVFSFNRTVGDITEATGFKKAYVIKEGRTVLDDGGGVCQDSTTLFRAVLNAGLPVVRRTAHAYRVGYYEQGFPPGLDATVFYPSVDFQFKNDTPAHILIQAYTQGATLYVDLFGTSDGRVTTLTKSIVANQTPPPAELRQDDPNLPKGEVKQVDWSAWGADVTFQRTVTRGGEVIIKETFKSNYRPWQAIYLVGTKE